MSSKDEKTPSNYLKGNILLNENKVQVCDLTRRWNLPAQKTIELLFIFQPPAYAIIHERYTPDLGVHYFCGTYDYDEDLLDISGDYREAETSLIQKYVYFNKPDILAIEETNPELSAETNPNSYCNLSDKNNIISANKHGFSDFKEMINSRSREFVGCTSDEIVEILDSNTMPKGSKNSLLAARFYLEGVTPRENIHSLIKRGLIIDDPDRQVRRWLQKAKKLLPGLRGKT